MATKIDASLFSWDNPQQLPRLQALMRVLEILPYQPLVETMAEKRGRGRNDFPTEAMFRLVVAGVVLQYPSAASLLRNLHTNISLAQVCGFNPLPRQQRSKLLVHQCQDGSYATEQVDYDPRITLSDDWAFSRFLTSMLDTLGERDYLREMFDQLRDQLMEAIPDFAMYLAYDGKAVESHSTGRTNKQTGKTSDTDATWGRHETVSIDKNGNAWKKVKQWFGYRVHAIIDSVSELPVDYRLTTATDAETQVLSEMLEGLSESCPEILDGAKQLSADRGLDAKHLYQTLHDDYDIDPVIANRNLWSQEKQDGNYDRDKPILRMLNDGKAIDNIVYAEDGTVVCRCPLRGNETEMCFMGYEKDRNTLKYRCPAKAGGYSCAGEVQCLENGDSKARRYGRTVRIKIDESNRRIFTATPRNTKKWKRNYNRRSAAERFFSRIGQGYNFDHHYVRGLGKMQAKASLAMAVGLAMAIAHIEAGRPKNMRSLVRPIPLLDSG